MLGFSRPPRGLELASYLFRGGLTSNLLLLQRHQPKQGWFLRSLHLGSPALSVLLQLMEAVKGLAHLGHLLLGLEEASNTGSYLDFCPLWDLKPVPYFLLA